MKNFFSFPELINEPAARLVASGVLLMSLASIVLISLEIDSVLIILLTMAYGFLARVSSGPKVSPLALLVTKFIIPKSNFEEKLVPGAPKRFAQSVGLVFSTSILILWLVDLGTLSVVPVSYTHLRAHET